MNNPNFNQPMAPQGPYDGPQPGKQLALIGLICGIVSLACSGIAYYVAWSAPVVGVILGVVFLLAGIAGIVLGVMGGKKNLEVGAPKGGLAKAAMIVGIIATVEAGIMFICTGCAACTACTLQSSGNRIVEELSKAASDALKDAFGY